MGTGLSSYPISASGGVTSVTLTGNQIPSHSHPFIADSKGATTASPANAYFADASPNAVYTVPNSSANPDPPNYRNMNAAMVSPSGGSQPHDNMQPYLAITFIISLFGVYPSPT
jgi:microcystin-dependent protein